MPHQCERELFFVTPKASIKEVTTFRCGCRPRGLGPWFCGLEPILATERCNEILFGRQGLLGVSLYLIHVWLLCRGHIADRSEAQILCIKFKLRFTSPGRILDPNICVVEVGCQEVPHEAPCAELPSDVVLAS